MAKSADEKSSTATNRKLTVLKNFGPWRPKTESGKPSVFTEEMFASTYPIPRTKSGELPDGIDPDTYHAMLLDGAVENGAIEIAHPDAVVTSIPAGPEGVRIDRGKNAAIQSSFEERRVARAAYASNPPPANIPASGSVIG